MQENRLFEALLDVVPFGAYAVDIQTYEIVYANKIIRENLYAPRKSQCWEQLFGQEQICSWCSIEKLKKIRQTRQEEKTICEFFDESDDRWLKSYDEIVSWPDGRDVKYSILVDITDQKEIQGDMIKSHAALAMKSKHITQTNKNLQITKLNLQKTVNELELQKQKAESATQSKSNFLANMSHEIRTPLNGIIGMTHLALHSDNEADRKKYLKKIDGSSKNLLHIVNDILDFSKIEAGKFELEKIDFSISEVLENLSDLFEYSAKEKGLEFTIQNDLKNDIYRGDPSRVGQVLINLVSNAIKFTHSGSVSIRVFENSFQMLEFIVEDTGIGISKQNSVNLFQSFSQLDEGMSRKYGGTGLGLSISKELVKMMNGDIEFESQKEQGSVFKVTLELEKGTQKTVLVKTSLSKLQEQLKKIEDFTILLVEDNQTNQEIIQTLLKPYNITVDIAQDGKKATQIFGQKEYDIVLMDLQMPVMDGYEASEIIRQSDTKTPIIAISANALKEDIDKTKDYGMNEHLVKPIEIESLYHLILKYALNAPSQSKAAPHQYFEHFNHERALVSLGGDTKLFDKTVQNFQSDYCQVSLQDLPSHELVRVIHTLKGLSANIGAYKLQNLCSLYEKSKSVCDLQMVQKELNLLLTTLEKFIKQNAQTSLEKTQMPQEWIQQQFELLKEAVASKRPNRYKKIVESLQQTQLSKSDEDKFKCIKKYLDAFDYKNALKVLDE